MTTLLRNVAEFTRVDGAPDATWFVHFMDTANALPEYAQVRRELSAALGDLAGATLLDVGCGTGDDARALAAQVGPGGRVVGVDLSGAMIDEAWRRSQGSSLPVEFQLGDVRHLSFGDGTFDGVQAKLVLMHCADIDSAAGELLRVAKPGGRVAVFDYDFETTTVDHPDRPATREVVRCACDGHPHGWSGRQLRRRFLDLGAREVAITPITAVLPYGFFRTAVGGRLATAQEQGQLDMTADELRAWWAPLEAAESRGRFFASLTGFVLAATR